MPSSSLTSFLYPLPSYRRDPLSIWIWWEARRVPYNLIVGATGCLTVVVISLASVVTSAGPPAGVIIGGSLVYALLANLCYTLGPVAEIGLDRFLGDQSPRAGPVLFRQGLVFSIGLTLFPVALAGLFTVARILAYLLTH